MTWLPSSVTVGCMMTFKEYVVDDLSSDFTRKEVGTLLGTVAAIVFVALAIATIPAIGYGNLFPYLVVLIVVAAMCVLVFGGYFAYSFIYWLINRKDM